MQSLVGPVLLFRVFLGDEILPNYMCHGQKSLYFHIIGDGHQPNSRGLYTHYKDSYERWDDHPQYSDF